jgi:putative FmdB family regulatory protein
MPCYTYYCNSCKKKFEVVCSYSQYSEHAKCEFCKKKNTERSYQDDLTTLNASVKLSDNEIKTIGHLAARNNEKFSEDYKQHLYEKHNSYKEETSSKELPKGMSRMKKTKTKMKWTKD